AKYVGNLGGALSKNLFLKDKKHRYYVVSALADTKVDLKVLSQRLGLGKGGLRMAAEEALVEILKANPPVGKDQPPDLAAFVPSDAPILSDLPVKASTQDSTGKHVSAASNSAAVAAKAIKPSGNAQNVKEKPVNTVQPSIPAADAGNFVEELLDRASALLLSEINETTQISEDSIEQHSGQLGAE
ncbi:hypothetical protein Goshw_029696, partial [Gossypium schwendimanii]|nr:hypothetical protein [Gossypium schwendimanii]